MAKTTRFDMLLALKTKGQAGLKRMGNSMQGLQGRLKNVRNAALSINTAFKAMAVILTATAFSRVVKGAIDQADAFGKLSRQTGIAADSLQAYVNAGKLAGVEQSTIEKGLKRLAQSQREASQGIKTYSDSYEALGISVKTSDGSLKTSEALLGDIADSFADMPNGATKAALAMEIFGRSGAQLIPMLNEGSKALNKWNYETSEGFAANAEYFNDQITMLGFSIDGFRKQLADELLPTLNNLLEMFSDVFNSQKEWQIFFTTMEYGLKTIASSLFTVVAGFRFLFSTLRSSAKGLGEFALGNFQKSFEEFGNGLTETGERFQKDMEVFKQIWTGESQAGDEYGFNKGTKEARNLATQLDKTFGTQMQYKLEQFNNSIKSVGESMADVVIKGIKGMEDALVEFVSGGKLSFRDLANSIIRDMIRIQIQQSITAPLSRWLGSLFTPAAVPFQNTARGKAAGGFVGAGSSYLVGERGPELFTPTSSGNITPNHKLGGATNVVVNVDASGNSQVQGNEQQSRVLGQLIAAAVSSRLLEEKRPGGILAPA